MTAFALPTTHHTVTEAGPLTTVRVHGDAIPNYTIEYSTDPRFIKIEGEEVPSVTTALGVLDKPALPWWGMKVGIEGVRQLVREAVLTANEAHHFLATGYYNHDEVTVEQVVELLTKHKLTVNHVKDKAGDRGHAIHDALEQYALSERLPDPGEYPEHLRGYLQSFALWLLEAQPIVEAAEVVVGSLSWGYGGRFDLRCRFDGYQDGSWIVDYKTSKSVYQTHLIQVRAYETASVEMGYLPTAGQAVLLLYPDGKKAKWVPSPCEQWHFTAVLTAWRAMDDLKARTRKRRK